MKKSLKTALFITLSICTIVIIGGIVFLWQAGIVPYSSYKTEVEIPDVSKPYTYTASVELRKNQQHIQKAEVRLTGEVDGIFSFNGQMIPAGKVDTIIHSGDWYEHNYYINYSPENVTQGSLKVDITLFPI